MLTVRFVAFGYKTQLLPLVHFAAWFTRICAAYPLRPVSVSAFSHNGLPEDS